MKTAFSALIFALVAPLAASAATCKVLIPSDAVQRSDSYDKTIISLNVNADEQTHYVVLSKDIQSAKEISQATYRQYKAEKFQAIAGQYVVVFMHSGNMTAISYGTADQNTGTVTGGALVYGVNGERTIVVPTGAKFATSCELK